MLLSTLVCAEGRHYIIANGRAVCGRQFQGTRGGKMFPTKTSRDVGMVYSVSDATGSSMERTTGGKSPGTRRSIL